MYIEHATLSVISYRVSSDIPIASHYRSHNNGNAFKNSVLNELPSCVLQCVLWNVFLLLNPNFCVKSQNSTIIQ